MDHRQIDERSLAFGQAIARHVAERPELVAQARATAIRRMETCSAAARPALQEWISILDGPIDGVLHVLTDRGERATRLRQSNPFAGVLSQAERNAILKQFQPHDPAAA